MRQGVKSAVAEVGTEQGVVVFLDKTVVVLLVKTAWREQVGHLLSKITQ